MDEKALVIAIADEMERRQSRDNIKRTRELLEHYRIMRVFLSTAISEATQITEWQGLGLDEGDKLESVRAARARTVLMMEHIKSALTELHKQCQKSKELHKYRALVLKYMKGLSNEEICEKLECGKASPPRWQKQMITELSMLLFGVNDRL